jgi:hypothetical protein
MVSPNFKLTVDKYEMPIIEKKGIDDWIHNSKKSGEQYQQMIKDGFDILELYF